MNAVAIETRNATAPVIHTIARRPRHAAMKNLPQRWTTMKKKNSSVPQRCVLFTKCPKLDVCHQAGPASAITTPDASTTAKAASVSTPKT